MVAKTPPSLHWSHPENDLALGVLLDILVEAGHAGAGNQIPKFVSNHPP